MTRSGNSDPALWEMVAEMRHAGVPPNQVTPLLFVVAHTVHQVSVSVAFLFLCGACTPVWLTSLAQRVFCALNTPVPQYFRVRPWILHCDPLHVSPPKVFVVFSHATTMYHPIERTIAARAACNTTGAGSARVTGDTGMSVVKFVCEGRIA